MFDLLFYFYVFAIILIPSFVLIWFFGFYVKKRKKIYNSLKFVLYEISFPQGKKDDEKRNFKELISVMEQFYAGMSELKPHLVLEVGLPYSGEEIVFYSSVSRDKSQLFEKQVQGIFPLAKVSIKKDDYNIFKPAGYSLGSIATLKRNFALPIKTYDKFESDPLQLIINTFSKLQKEGEGAALQIVLSGNNNDLMQKIKSAVSKIREGKTFGEAVKPNKGFLEQTFEIISELVSGSSSQKNKNDDKIKPIDEELIKLLSAKASRQIINTNIRLLVSAENKGKAESILSELESAFSQFNEVQGNAFNFIRLSGRKLKNLFFDFSFRIPNKNNIIPLGVSELSSVFHFPSDIISSSAPNLKFSKSNEAASPLNVPLEGLLLGRNSFRGEEKKIFMKNDDRRRHVYVIGQTGTGKSVLLKNMIIQDIEAGRGVCFIDPHGSDLQDILSRIPRERIDDLIYFNPGDIQRPMGLNMLEYDQNYPEQKTFIVNELLGIFDKLFDMKVAGGPAFEQYFRNATLLVMDDPASGNTLLEVARIFTDKNFRDYKISKCKNPIVVTFWRELAEKSTGEQSLQNFGPYITNKFDNFISNEIMRPIISQEKSAFNFRKVMDEKKILLVNLSKGRLGDLNSNLIGLIVVGKLLMASLSRVDMPESQRNDFYLYIDEFQNVTTDSIATILSEARKYKLNLIIAHQYIGQIEENIKKAVFGNVGSIATFRVGSEDAEFLVKQFEPVFNSYDLINVDNYNAFLKLLIDGQTSQPFNIRTIPFKTGDSEFGKGVAQLSASRYGRTRLEIEEEINKRYNL